MEGGISGEAVAKALGHESLAITTSTYALPGAGQGARAERVADLLTENKKGRKCHLPAL
jgi:hypothetical protein